MMSEILNGSGLLTNMKNCKIACSIANDVQVPGSGGNGAVVVMGDVVEMGVVVEMGALVVLGALGALMEVTTQA